MARDLYTLAFVEGKGWVPAEATPEQEAERVAAYEAVATLLATTKDRKRRRDLEDLRKAAHRVCAQVCMVEVNVGSIRSIEEGARNTRVNIDADGLAIPIHGYIDMTDFAVWDQVAKIRANFGRCRYRIVVRRTADIHPSVPWAEVEAPPEEGEEIKRVRIRDLVALSPLEVAGAGPADAPAAAAAASPASSTALVAGAPAPVASATALVASATLFPQPPDGPLVCPLCGHATAGGGPVIKHEASGRFAHRVCPADDAFGTAPTPAPAPAPDQPSPAGSPDPQLGKGPLVAEGKPWERDNSDHSLNLGSDAILASVSMTDLAVDLLDAHLAEAGEAGPPAPAAIKALASLLLLAADRTQQIVRADHHFNRGDRSHTRARGMVRIALRYHPVPWRQAEESQADIAARRQAWLAALVDYASMLLQTAVDLDR